MKSYIQGLITGGVLVFALFVLMGANDNSSEIGKYQMSSGYNGTYIIDSTNGKLWRQSGSGWKLKVGKSPN
tara:strand:- start:199 stop:411 length:213 start_codon:yes stop_codon:yes gene_type:complete